MRSTSSSVTENFLRYRNHITTTTTTAQTTSQSTLDHEALRSLLTTSGDNIVGETAYIISQEFNYI